MKRNVTLKIYLLTICILLSPHFVKAYQKLQYKNALTKIYLNCDKYYTGMKISDFYKITGSKIKPTVRIELNRLDSSYHHYIYYPTLDREELTFRFEFDPYREIIIEKGLPESCPEI